MATWRAAARRSSFLATGEIFQGHELAVMLVAALGTTGHRPIALLGEPPDGQHHEWASQWLGTYSEHPFIRMNDRPTFVKTDSTSKIMWNTAAGHWQLGRESDLASGWGLIAGRDESAALPDDVRVPWQIAVRRGEGFEPGSVPLAGAPERRAGHHAKFDP